MSDRDVTMKDLISLIANGEIIEDYPNRQPCPAALMLGFISGNPCHVVVANAGRIVERGDYDKFRYVCSLWKQAA